MARKKVVPTQVNPQEGVTLPFVTVDLMNGMRFYNNGSTLLLVRNRSVVNPVDVTIIAVPDEAGRAVDYPQTIQPTLTGLFGPFQQSWWNQTFSDSGYVWFDVSTDVDVSVSAITLF